MVASVSRLWLSPPTLHRYGRAMRTVLTLLALATLLGGCASTRRVLGQYQGIADKGVQLGNGGPPDAADAPTPADPKHPNLPGTLGGDAEHRAYTTPPKG